MTIAIVGLGLIGTSAALAARRPWSDARLIGIDRQDVITHPRVVEIFNLAATTLSPIVEADIVVLAAPVDAILDLLPHVSSHVRSDALVIDTGSTKRAIVRAARAAGVRMFVGGHPMAGAAASGPDAARVDLFERRPWFLIGTDAAMIERARAFVENLGARAILMDDDGAAHDRLMAAVSHLPQLVASALMARVGAAVGATGLEYGGDGLRDTTRLASSSADVWASILATNAGEVAPLVTALADDLRALAGRLDDAAAVRALFDEANHWQRAIGGHTKDTK